LNRQRQRKLEARANRQESLARQGVVTAEKTIIQVLQPKELVKKEKVFVSEKKQDKIPVVADIVKRGPGRPPKALSDKNKITTKKVLAMGSKKKPTILSKGKK